MSAIYVVTGPRPIESPPSRVAEVPREPQQPLVVGHLRSSTRLVYTFEAFLTHALEVCTPTDPQPAECPTTIIPPLLGHLYRAHPSADFDSTRSLVTLALLWAWSLRLTHSYFRREDWKFGEREDWRYTKSSFRSK